MKLNVEKQRNITDLVDCCEYEFVIISVGCPGTWDFKDGFKKHVKWLNYRAHNYDRIKQ